MDDIELTWDALAPFPRFCLSARRRADYREKLKELASRLSRVGGTP